MGDRHGFLSLHGRITALNLGGAVMRVVATHDLVAGADQKAGWRPGGCQNFAVGQEPWMNALTVSVMLLWLAVFALGVMRWA